MRNPYLVADHHARTMMTGSNPRLQSGDALLVVDVQSDFLPGGRLGVPHGEEVIPVLNRYSAVFQKKGLPIFATCDRHPADHCSFREHGGDWPPHCVAGTEGAAFAPGLDLPVSVTIIAKATSPEKDAYSGFEGTALDVHLRTTGIKRLFIGGLATDYCVLNTVKDAVRLGYTVVVLEDAIRAVNMSPDDGQRAVAEMVRLGCQFCTADQVSVPHPRVGPLLVDLYQITMLQAYFEQKKEDIAVFEFFIRRLPPNRGFLLAVGLEQVLEYLETLRFTSADLEWLEDTGRFSKPFLDYLGHLRFSGDVHAMPEGTVFFANEPILRITAPLPQAQFIESRIINLLHFQTLVASKAARSVLAAPGKLLVDFGLRRAHGAEAGLLAARASYIAGFAGSATVLAASSFGVPVYGTMSHSFVQAYDDELLAFESFARSQPGNAILLLDTYDTERAAEKVTRLAPRLQKEGIAIQGVRLDSGNIVELARSVRRILDAGNLPQVKILASGDLDEYALLRFAEEKAPIDGFGIGTHMVTSADAPYLNCVYKLQEYAGKARYKLSEEKATRPGRKQVYRSYGETGAMKADLITLENEPAEGEPLLRPFMREGRRLAPPAPLFAVRQRAAEQMAILPQPLHSLDTKYVHPVTFSRSLQNLQGKK